MRIAITGGTGFVGSHLIDRAVADGHDVRALTRRPQEPRLGVQWISGALDRPESLAALVEGVDAIVHVAGVVKGGAQEFRHGNVEGTEAVLEAAAHAGVGRFVHVSSLAAREPELSAYGWSKCASEEAVMLTRGDWTIIRPAVIFGPRDTELLALFRAAKRGIVPLPSKGRTSVIAVQDLAALMLACLANPMSYGKTYEVDDNRPDGWSHRELAGAIGDAVGRRVRTVTLPAPLIRLAARADSRIRRGRAQLTPDRAGYWTHPDWVARSALRPPLEVYAPQVGTRTGLLALAAWYRAHGLL